MAALVLLLAAALSTPWSAMIVPGVTHYVRAIPRSLPIQDAFVAGPVHADLPAALAAAADGDTIILPAGDYSGELTVERSVRLLGVGSGELPVLRGRLILTADGASVVGLRFRRAGSYAAVEVQGARDVLVSRCEFDRLPAALRLKDARAVRVEDNRFLFCTSAIDVSGGGGHLLLRNLVESGGTSPVRLERSEGCRVEGNTLRRSGWTALVVHSLSSGTQIIANHFEDAIVGLAVQTRDNLIAENSFSRCQRGLLLGVTPLGMDHSIAGQTVFVDSRTRDAVVSVDGNLVRDNTFSHCQREGALLRHASHNELRGNRFARGGGHDLVLMSGSDENTISGNDFEASSGDALRLLDSRGNRLLENIFSGSSGARDRSPGQQTGTVPVRLFDAADNELPPGLARSSDPAGAPRRSLPALDGSGDTILWGDFHTHSVLSDGSSSPEELLRYARDVLDLDFVALSDHGEVLARQTERWPLVNTLCSDYAVSGRFVTLPGYEVTFPMHWDGHYNVYFPHDRGTLHRSPYDDYQGLCDLTSFTPQRLLDTLAAEGEEHIVIRHHFGASLDYWLEAPEDPTYLPATEICSVHGIFSGERDLDLNHNQPMGETQGHVSTVGGGLQSGRVFAIVGSSDSHYGFPGDDGLAAVMVRSVSAQGIIDALRERRSWATTGARIVLSLTVDGAPMGSTISPGQQPPFIVARVQGTDDLLEVALLRNGSVVRHAELSAATAELAWSDSRAAVSGTWYQLRATQVDGQLAWSTPVWFDPRPPRRVDAAARWDKTAMSLMLYSLQLRAWPRLGLGVLGGDTPLQALADPERAGMVARLWVDYCRSVVRLNELARELGPADQDQAQRLVDRYAGRWGDNLPNSILNTDPMINLDEIAVVMGLPLP